MNPPEPGVPGQAWLQCMDSASPVDRQAPFQGSVLTGEFWQVVSQRIRLWVSGLSPICLRVRNASACYWSFQRNSSSCAGCLLSPLRQLIHPGEVPSWWQCPRDAGAASGMGQGCRMGNAVKESLRVKRLVGWRARLLRNRPFWAQV